MDTSQLFAECQRMIPIIAPELSRVYMVERPDGYPTKHALAWQTDCDPMVQAQLEAAGQWRGPAPMIVFDMLAIFHEMTCAPLPGMLGLAIHEIGHALPRREPVPALTADAPTIETFKTEFNAGEKIFRRIKQLCPWDYHCHKFNRIVLHLDWRARAAGFEPCSPMCGGYEYALSPNWEYAEALGDEPERFQAMTFAEIEAQPAPFTYMELWADDVLRFKRERDRNDGPVSKIT